MIRSCLFTAGLFLAFSCVTSQDSIAAGCSAVRKCLQQNETCEVLPVPNTTNSKPFEVSEFTLTEVRKGVYSFRDGGYISMIILENNRLVVVDFPHNFLESLPNGELKLNVALNQLLTGRTICRMDVIYSHADADHFGNAAKVIANLTVRFPDAQTVVWGTEETRRRLESNDALQIPKIQRIICERKSILTISGSLLLNMYMVQGHSFGDILIQIPGFESQPSVVYIADYVWPGYAPVEYFGFPADFGIYIRTLELLKSLNPQVLIPGHEAIGSYKDVKITLEYARDTLKFAEEAGQKITPAMRDAANINSYFDPESIPYGNTAYFFQKNTILQASICRRKLIAKYGCQLAGVAVTSRAHCLVAVFWTLANTI